VHPPGFGVQVPPPSAFPHDPGGSKAQNCPGAHWIPALPPQNTPPPVLLVAVAVAVAEPVDPPEPVASELAEVSTEPLHAVIAAETASVVAIPICAIRMRMRSS
jgi:hypothetical protein